MNNIEQIHDKVWFIDAEPGDATHYSFLVYRDGPDNFTIAPRCNTFRYPQHINRWQDFAASDEHINKTAKAYNCNPWTVKIVIETCEYIYNNFLYI